MAIATTRHVLLFTIIMVLLNGINGQLTVSVASVPHNMNIMMENITDTSTLTYDSQQRMESRLDDTVNALNQMVTVLQMQSEQLQNMTAVISQMVGQQNQFLHTDILVRDCSDLGSRGPYSSGVYTIQPWDDQGSFPVYCDMDTDSGGWTVLQKRFDGLVDFYLGWDAYEDGFGSPDGEHWTGLKQMYRLTRQGTWTLRIDLEDFEDNTAYALYDSFSLGNAESFYQLSIGAYSGTASDALTYHNNQAFSTKNSDHDGSGSNCAQNRQGAWWYDNCAYSNLNGLYLGASQTSNTGIEWYYWKSASIVLKRSEIKMRRIL